MKKIVLALCLSVVSLCVPCHAARSIFMEYVTHDGERLLDSCPFEADDADIYSKLERELQSRNSDLSEVLCLSFRLNPGDSPQMVLPKEENFFKKMPYLAVLGLAGCNLTDDCLNKLQGLDYLRRLDLSDNQLEHPHITRERFPMLEKLYLSSNPIKHLPSELLDMQPSCKIEICNEESLNEKLLKAIAEGNEEEVKRLTDLITDNVTTATKQ